MSKRKRKSENLGCLGSLVALSFFLVALPFIIVAEVLKFLFKSHRTVNLQSDIDKMEGHEFEYWCAELLRRNGYRRVEVTRGSGDQGVDIIAYKDNQKYAIQCKRYAQKLSNKPIQEVHTGKAIYHCDVAVVMTNNYFTSGARDAAAATGVLLWDRTKLAQMLNAK